MHKGNRIVRALAPLIVAVIAPAAPSFTRAAEARQTQHAATSSMKSLINKDANGVALQGHDAVAFFTMNKPVKGDPRHSVRHSGATYWFSSAQHKALFEANPEKYTPAFGGYCGYAASIDRISPVDVNFFQIIDGRLILQHNQKALDLWNKDLEGNVGKADRNWPGLVEKNGKPEKTLVNVNKRGVALDGHDPVAYFVVGAPVKGNQDIYATFNGAVYWFASQDNRAMFELDPAKFEPAFGGYCGYAASINKISPVDPAIFQIIDGRLVLQHTRKAYDLFNKDAETSLRRADANWHGLVERRGK